MCVQHLVPWVQMTLFRATGLAMIKNIVIVKLELMFVASLSSVPLLKVM